MEALNTHQVQQVVFEHQYIFSSWWLKKSNHWEFDEDDKNSDDYENDDGKDDNGHSDDDGNDDEDDNNEDEDEDSENDAIQISSTAVYSQACIRERGPTESHTETPITNLSTRIFWSLDKDKV